MIMNARSHALPNPRLNWLHQRLALRIAAVVAALSLLLSSGPAFCVEPQPVEYLWLHHPDLGFNWFRKNPRPKLNVSLSALRSQYATERLQAAQSIVRLSDEVGAMRPELLEALLTGLEQGNRSQLSARSS
jgi:hypothetical protein